MKLDDTNVFKDIDLPRGSLAREDEELLYDYGQGIVLEIGTFFGRSAVLLAQNAQQVYTIDRFTGRGDYPDFNFYNVNKQIKQFKNSEKIQILKGESIIFKDFFPDNFLDVLFIDGAHDLIPVASDFIYFFTKVKENGFILFHDYCELYPDIVYLCDSLKDNIIIKYIETKGMITVFQKVGK
jgi:hypothetical protein